MRLIDADKFAERINASPAFPNMGQDGYFLREIVLDFLDKQPAVDIKTEVAREIFAEIEEVCRNYYEKLSKPTNSSLEDMLFQGERFVVNEMWHDIAELKNKYIGGAGE